MLFTSTTGAAPPCDLGTALFRGLAPDGGLYLPSSLVPLERRKLEALRGADMHAAALAVAPHLFGDDLDRATLERLLRDSLDFDVPLVQLDERLFALELFHGPTLAFKDIGVRFMARLMAHVLERGDRPVRPGRPLMVITATSGDTGGAVAHAFRGIADTRVVILFPRGQVSPIQRRQFTTVGENVHAIAVRGTFDDCQRLAKDALRDESIRSAYRVTSANSINVGRLLPQVFYYVHLWSQLPSSASNPLVSVPSGNLGNLTAGLIAKRLGVPIERFVAATNRNDVLPRYLRTGAFTPRPSLHTISSAMDVGNPSNFARIRALYAGREDELGRDVLGSAHSDDETRHAIAGVYEWLGYLLDPHSAVGYLGLTAWLDEVRADVGVFLATAHPAKFGETVASAIGRQIPLPESLATLLVRDEHAVEIDASVASLNKTLLEE